MYIALLYIQVGKIRGGKTTTKSPISNTATTTLLHTRFETLMVVDITLFSNVLHCRGIATFQQSCILIYKSIYKITQTFCRSGFNHRPVHMGFMVDKVALGQVFLRVLWFFPVCTIPPMLHIHILFICCWWCIVLAIDNITKHFYIQQGSTYKRVHNLSFIPENITVPGIY